jgi:hypothetical protein
VDGRMDAQFARAPAFSSLPTPALSALLLPGEISAKVGCIRLTPPPPFRSWCAKRHFLNSDIANAFQRENNGAKDDMLGVLAEAEYEFCFALKGLKVTTGSFFTSSLTKFTKGIICKFLAALFLLPILEVNFLNLCKGCQHFCFKHIFCLISLSFAVDTRV